MSYTYYKKPYITSQGERWDEIAYAFYGNAMRTAPLVEANPAYADVLVFGAGIALQIPILDQSLPSSLPPWKQVNA